MPALTLSGGQSLALGSSTVRAVYRGSELKHFNPRAIPNLAAWWDASFASTVFDAASGGSVQSADDGLVARLEDRSGNGNHCTQSGADTIKPILKTGQINGRNVLRFDGTDDRMNFTGIDANVFTVLIIGRKWNSSNDTFIGVSHSSGVSFALPYIPVDLTGLGTYVSRQTTGTNGSFAGSTTRQLERTTAFQVTATSTIGLWVDGNVVSLNDSGTLNNNAASVFNVISARATNSGAVFGKQEIGEVLFYSRVLSDTERQAAERYLKAKWGTP